MQDLPYRIRTADPSDGLALRESIVRTLAHPDGGSRRSSYKGAADRGELLLLERNVPRDKAWRIEAFVDYHLKVDDTLTIRDIGSSSDPPSRAAIKQLLLNLLHTPRLQAASVKVRQDASDWNDIVTDIPGFEEEGREYRRPHYNIIWRWTREAETRAQRAAGRGPRRA